MIHVLYGTIYFLSTVSDFSVHFPQRKLQMLHIKSSSPPQTFVMSVFPWDIFSVWNLPHLKAHLLNLFLFLKNQWPTPSTWEGIGWEEDPGWLGDVIRTQWSQGLQWPQELGSSDLKVPLLLYTNGREGIRVPTSDSCLKRPHHNKCLLYWILPKYKTILPYGGKHGVWGDSQSRPNQLPYSQAPSGFPKWKR